MDNYCLNDFFRNVGQTIKVYLATETIEDPYEKNVSLTDLNPLPLKAIVTDLIASQAQWKMPGIEIEKAKQIIIKKNRRNLIEQSHKIEIDNEFYWGWRVNGRMQIREEGDFLRIYVYIKKV